MRFADELVRGARVALLECGWYRMSEFYPPAECEALRDRAGEPWRPLAEQVGPVRQQGWYCQPPLGALPSAVRSVADELAASLAQQMTDLAVQAEFNEITWQRHAAGVVGVGPHRDQSFYDGVIAVITLAGRARFAILGSRNSQDVIEAWTASPGDLLLLRGGGLGHPEARCPWHEVGTPDDGERETLTFRHTTRTPGGWE